jgi:hypothetical protein
MKQKGNKCTCPLPIQQQTLGQQQMIINASTKLQVYGNSCYRSMYEANDKYIAAIIN